MPRKKVVPLAKDLKTIQAKKEEVQKRREELKAGLPHLHRFPWYSWAWSFFKSRNPMNLLCAANQISKSSTQIRKCIEWAGNKSIWPELWPTAPRQFWYLYPSQDVINSEWLTKWVPEFMPTGDFVNHPTYGWKVLRDGKDILGIVFNSGVVVYFKTYSQNIQNLQTATIHAVFCDEELPEHMYSELHMRVSATDGYFHMVFTATLNQNFWKMALEGEGEFEKFPTAWKMQVSMYDCMFYMDGTPGAYTEEKINRIKAGCKSQTEIERRVMGRFVTEMGRTYPQFDITKHFIKPFKIPDTYMRYVGIDLGSGGEGHPPAIVFVAVNLEKRYGVVYKGWMGDDGANYTAGDVYKKYLDMKGSDPIVEQRYDQQARDFRTITDRAGDTFMGADKRHERGEDIVNSLFKKGMLQIFNDADTEDPQLQKLCDQLTALLKETSKKKAKDDFPDALRYCVVTIPWDFTNIVGEPTDAEKEANKNRPMTDDERVALEIEERRGEFSDKPKDSGWDEVYTEIEEWNEMY